MAPSGKVGGKTAKRMAAAKMNATAAAARRRGQRPGQYQGVGDPRAGPSSDSNLRRSARNAGLPPENPPSDNAGRPSRRGSRRGGGGGSGGSGGGGSGGGGGGGGGGPPRRSNRAAGREPDMPAWMSRLSTESRNKIRDQISPQFRQAFLDGQLTKKEVNKYIRQNKVNAPGFQGGGQCGKQIAECNKIRKNCYGKTQHGKTNEAPMRKFKEAIRLVKAA